MEFGHSTKMTSSNPDKSGSSLNRQSESPSESIEASSGIGLFGDMSLETESKNFSCIERTTTLFLSCRHLFMCDIVDANLGEVRLGVPKDTARDTSSGSSLLEARKSTMSRERSKTSTVKLEEPEAETDLLTKGLRCSVNLS